MFASCKQASYPHVWIPCRPAGRRTAGKCQTSVFVMRKNDAKVIDLPGQLTAVCQYTDVTHGLSGPSPSSRQVSCSPSPCKWVVACSARCRTVPREVHGGPYMPQSRRNVDCGTLYRLSKKVVTAPDHSGAHAERPRGWTGTCSTGSAASLRRGSAGDTTNFALRK